MRAIQETSGRQTFKEGAVNSVKCKKKETACEPNCRFRIGI